MDMNQLLKCIENFDAYTYMVHLKNNLLLIKTKTKKSPK